jgi:poly(ADP-ribose) glycohydrolase ARH3
MLGLALGDAIGAPFEGGAVERFAWKVIGRLGRSETKWTDDTQMSLDLADSLVACGGVDQDDLAQRFARGFNPFRGYGGGAARLLKRIRKGADWREANRAVFPDGSYGNGAAMRAPVVGVFHASRPGGLVEATTRTAEVTHAHPLGIEGAVVVAAAAAAAAGDEDPFEAAAAEARLDPFVERFGRARAWLRDDAAPEPAEVVGALGNGIAAAESCVTAVYLAARFRAAPFMELLSFTADCGGDVDTIGAMAGGIWGAARGVAALPEDELQRLEQRDRIATAGQDLHAASVA